MSAWFVSEATTPRQVKVGRLAHAHSSTSPAMLCTTFGFNPLKTKRRLLYLKNPFVPRSKLFISVIKTKQFML